MDLVVVQRDVVLVYRVPLLDADLLGPSAQLGGGELFQVADCVILVTFHADLLTHPVIKDYLDHRQFVLSRGSS
eukprot:CAMPEP_0173246038 /NCGR_PEP_ID=MMETSP1142-20121109/17080_1 /TAXON_ID=483371 /ORGANISM="non described non described, Strain CCMP2298" /LENGTH=73 /DNA_ID=CAMNT_0014178187 /DNA_START=544 /DNA_END=765 /DNA_ORIENTATION=+